MYFGGGTPSLVPPEQIAAIVNAVARRYTLASDTEVTIEVNPGKDLDERGYAALLAAGVKSG